MPQHSRRAFLQQSAALGIGVGLNAALPARAVAANDKIRMACIGVRGRGFGVMQAFAAHPDCDITHICDVNESVRLERGDQMKDITGTKPKLVNDFRELLEDDSVDCIMVATPDHWHALLTIHGCLAGKDVYVEKPASHNIVEGRVAVNAAHKHNRIVQMGTQIRSAPFLHEAREYVRSGAIGKVIYGKAWETDHSSAVHLQPDGDVPPGFDYEIWQGPVTERAYNPSIVGGAWRWLFDYGTGDLGNDGVHRLDYCRFVMGLDDLPQAVSCSGGKFFFTDDDQQWPDTMLVSYEYPQHIMQYEMRLWSQPRLFDATEGAAIYGENGWVLIVNTRWRAFDAKGKLVKEGTSGNDEIMAAHSRNFLDAMRSRQRDSLNQEILSGHVSSTICHLGNIAWRTGKKLKFDAAAEKFDDAEANNLLGREHRKGWELPTV
ncbi:MAG: Gfo/Idh/MocA family oxidoreductase [Planctomycetaceae bacterium]|nr:Gfo/Idh/MocA family oxidoreductase [Planctomycetaceae bacterium]